jgi:hypothetical protein
MCAWSINPLPYSLVEHPNVVQFIGYTVAPYAIIMEYLPNSAIPIFLIHDLLFISLNVS